MNKSTTLLLVWLVSISLLLGCSKETSRITQNAFYYWETSFELNQEDTAYLSDLAVKKMYVHFFDVTYTDVLSPEGRIHFSTKVPSNLQIVPVVFITNETISKLDSLGIADLANKITTRLHKEITRTQLTSQVREIQLDCDWTKTTRDKYFYLLKLVKKTIPYELSATVRLHQYKYHQGNIPPVDRGMLMCYNINDPRDYEVENSLFDKQEVMRYIKDVNYPLALDLAVPTFSWGVRFTPDKKFNGLTNSLRMVDVMSDTNFVSTSRKNVFVVKRDFSHYWYYFNAGDMVRIEECNPKDVQEIVSYLKTQLNQPQATLTLFHYDRILKQHENKAELQELFNAGR